MPKYIPPSLRKDSKIFVPGIKSKIPGKEEFPSLTKDTNKIPSRQLGSWGIGINPETLKSLKDKKIDSSKIQKITSLHSLPDDGESETYYSEDEGSDEFFDNPQTTTYNEDELHQDVTGFIKSKITM